MTLLRQLKVQHSPDDAEGPCIRVAFASTDGKVVDQHLAVAARFVLFRVSKTTVAVVGIGEFATMPGSEERGRLATRLAWLSDCDVVYAVAVGSKASMQLMARGVLPLRAPKGSSISAVLLGLQQELDESVAGWLEQVLRFKKSFSPPERTTEPKESQESKSWKP